MTLSNSKRPKLLIDFIIVGGGIGGLAMAYALAKSGHGVKVFEKSNGSPTRSGGLRVPPNLTKILLEWGLHEELRVAPKCRKSNFHTFETGEIVGHLEWQEDIIREAGADFLLMHHYDLHQALYRLAISVGASVTFETSIQDVNFNQDARKPCVVLEDGTTVEADVVIGADGHRSIVRNFVAPEVDEGSDTNHSFYTVIVPASAMETDPDLREYAGLPEWPIWMGDSRGALGYPIRNGTEYNLHVYWPDNEVNSPAIVEESWDLEIPTNAIDFEGYDPRIKKLFNLVPTAHRARFVRREVVDDWLDESGRVLLVGDAAHPLLPCSTQSASLAVEDAAVLGGLMSRLSTSEQIPQFLEAFCDIRHERCKLVQSSELRNAMLVTLPPGEDRDLRNEGMKLSLKTVGDSWDDSMLREQWDEIGEVFGYNAIEAAEDWWIKWGALGNAGAQHYVHEAMQDFGVKITTKTAVTEPISSY
ncbi:hypothetical protein AGABI2DRAFT_206335 [Agaricus bisporus var. bisporus H97]|uniref:hypothetical protein n=1 Tax=Agaricus bisporus var. bisporus (strain H97 / ATCC MYA-4626 / FGSC 10389) TaxID=936046 RepID=UPI00029F5471|nr:hypothetical protein AGABI2DRAFT_206335 [Agaricus bisporus var. bisporus H97]EKV46795.1 hypothetical protein AGABI2DRAFT_206335 [Agaricus bisporus var. bisporus H97]